MEKETKVATSNASVIENAAKAASVKVKENNVMKVHSINKNDMISIFKSASRNITRRI